MLQLLVSLLPSLISLIHVAEVSNPALGNGAAKQQSVLDMFKVILETVLPDQAPKIEAVLAAVQPLIAVVVAISNAFGWNSKLLQQAAVLVLPKQMPAPVIDLSIPAN